MRRSVLIGLIVLCAAPLVAQQHPNVQKGFQADRVYQFGDVDSINLYNGGLLLRVAIGNQYGGNGQLRYGLGLAYSNNAWDREVHIYYTVEQCEPDPSINPWCNREYIKAVPSRRSNAGMGWRLSLGRLLSPSDPAVDPGPAGSGTAYWAYESPDGADHAFSLTDPADPNIRHTQDGSYLRLVPVTDSKYEVHFTDGMIHKFAPFGYTHRLESIRDPFGNRVFVSYGANGNWTLTEYDAANTIVREHYVRFRILTGDEAPQNAPANYNVVLDEVDLAAFAGQRAIYDFQYTTDTIPYGGCADSDSRGAETPNPKVPRLRTITLPDLSTWIFDYFTFGCSSVKEVKFPTKGKIEFTYGTYAMPTAGCRAWEVPDTGEKDSPYTYTEGVATKKVLPGDGTSSEWTYIQTRQGAHYEACPVYGAPGGTLPVLKHFQSTVTVEVRPIAGSTPVGKTEYFFSILDNPSVPNTNFDYSEYALPFTRDGVISECGADRSALCLSSRQYDCRSGTCQLKRSRYVRYEGESRESSGGYEEFGYRREVANRTVFNDDGAKYVDTVRSQYDGLGNFRNVVTTDSWSGLSRVETTNFNPTKPAVTVNPVTWENTPANNRPSPSETWLLRLFNSQSVSEGGQQAISHFCFDAVTGYLRRRRFLKESVPGLNDVLHIFTPDGNGNTILEQYFGGDSPDQALQDAPLCAMSPPSPRYQISNTYQYGALSRSQHLGSTFYSFDADIDANTGLASKTREGAGLQIAGLETTQTYDKQGRTTSSQPPAGHGGKTQYDYTAPTDSVPASVDILQKNNAGTATLAQSKVIYDGLGRAYDELRLLPSGWSTRRTVRNGLGWTTRISELEGTPSHFTDYEDYDPFGRPATIRKPDGTTTTYAYIGARETQRTVSISTPSGAQSSTTKEIYNGIGRLWQVKEPSDNDAETTTQYAYHPSGNVSGVTTAGQTRTFAYDGRGFLVSETHPESGTTSYKYDARGHLIERTDANLTKVVTTYDAAERPDKVYRNTATPGNELKEFLYGQNNAGSDYRNGKVIEAKRHNRDTPLGSDIVVAETYVYAGKDGRISNRTTSISGNPNYAYTFAQSFTYEDAGRSVDLSYPRCTGGPCPTGGPTRIVRNEYHDGRMELRAVNPTGLMVTSVSPSYGTSSGSVTITGSGFVGGASVKIGTDVVSSTVFSDTTISANLPPAPAGTPLDVTVTNPDGTSATLARGYLVMFNDVPMSYIFQPFVEKLFRNSVTSGCGGGNYCPDSSTTHAQMAAFMVASKHGGSFATPPAWGGVFADIGSMPPFFQRVIEQVGREGISTAVDRWNGGCQTWNGYCPNDVVTRAHMAPMLLRAKYGRNYTPPPITNIFSDVPPNSYFAPWIEQLYREGITSGCAIDPLRYCPDSPVTRGQMSAFLVRTLKIENFPPRGYASWISYHANGAVNQVTHGNGMVDTQGIDAATMMARPHSLSFLPTSGSWPAVNLGTYGYDGAGNITAIGSDVFRYDLVSRLKDASANQPWAVPRNQTYAYDRFGNLTSITTVVNGGQTNLRSFVPSAATNRITAYSPSYDAAGRLLSWTPPHTVPNYPEQYTYDEIGMPRYYSDGIRALHHFYTADDERIWTHDPLASSGTFRIRDLGKKVLREFSVSTENGFKWEKDYVYRDGLLLAAELPLDLQHFHLDHLGTPRLVTSAGGARRSWHWYYGFGEEAGTIAEEVESMRFTGHERDLTGSIYSDLALNVDYMHARQYSALLGRFLSVDPGRDWDLHQPQSWNMYAYVRNNPVNRTDPTGRWIDTVVDVGSLGYGIGQMWAKVGRGEAVTWRDNAAVGADLAAAFVPGLTGAGSAVRVATHAEDIGRTANIIADTARGRKNEAKVLDAMGLKKNTEKITNANGRSVPDFQTSTAVGEIKDTARACNTCQMRVQREGAVQSGRDHVVVTGTNTKVSKPLEEKSRIIRRDDLGPP